MSANKLAEHMWRVPTLRVDPVADSVAAPGKGCGYAVVEADALRVALPVCAPVPVTGRVERGNSLIAPKPNIGQPH